MTKRCSVAALVVALVGLLCAWSSLWAQAPMDNGVPVHTVVTVEPRHGNGEPPAVNREDVMVFEGKERDKVIDWVPAQGEHGALEFLVMLDDGSNATLGTQFDDIKKFINGLPDGTKVGIAYMQNGIARIVQEPTSDHALAAKAIRLPMGIAGANASPYFALSDLAKRWPATADVRHEVLMVSDGIDRYYPSADLQDPYLEEAIEDAQRAGIIVSAIYTPGIGHFGHSGWRTYWGQLYLAQVAEKTGGESYYIGFNGPPVTFAPYLEDQTRRLNHQYLLTFLAKPPKKSGLQRVKITTEISGADLVAPEEVYVPAPER